MALIEKIPIRDAKVGFEYFTPRGLKVRILSIRGDDVLAKCITSGGHEIVIPGGVLVVCDTQFVPELIPDDDAGQDEVNKEVNFTDDAFKIYRIIQESTIPTDWIATLAGVSVDVIESEMHKMLSLSTVNKS